MFQLAVSSFFARGLLAKQLVFWPVLAGRARLALARSGRGEFIRLARFARGRAFIREEIPFTLNTYAAEIGRSVEPAIPASGARVARSLSTKCKIARVAWRACLARLGHAAGRVRVAGTLPAIALKESRLTRFTLIAGITSRADTRRLFVSGLNALAFV